MVFALTKYCNSNLFCGDEGKRKLRISVPLFSVSIEHGGFLFIVDYCGL